MKNLLPVACALLAGCTSLADRYAAGNDALSTGEGVAYLVTISPRLRDVLNECIPQHTPGASPVIVLVADVDVRGTAHGVDIEPDSAGTDCVVARLSEKPLPRPPLAPGAKRFPIGLRIETR